MRTKSQKKQQQEIIIEQLKKAPIVQLACEKTGVPRATFYRWRQKEVKFAAAVDAAVESGTAIINDLAESQLIAAIQNGQIAAMIFWLKNRHPAFASRLEISARGMRDDTLTPDQQRVLAHALSLLMPIQPAKVEQLPPVTDDHEK